MSTPYTINADDTKSFEAPVREVRVDVGTVTVTQGEDVTVVKAGDTHDCGDTASNKVHAVTGSRIVVTYSDEAPPRKTTKKKK